MREGRVGGGECLVDGLESAGADDEGVARVVVELHRVLHALGLAQAQHLLTL